MLNYVGTLCRHFSLISLLLKSRSLKLKAIKVASILFIFSHCTKPTQNADVTYSSALILKINIVKKLKKDRMN